MLAAQDNYRDRVFHFLDVIKGSRNCLIVTHNNPDPDAVASAYGLAHLFKTKFKKEAVIAYKGIVGRAENRALIDVLQIDMAKFYKLNVKKFDCVILVDTQFTAHNHPLKSPPDAVIDHHNIIKTESQIPHVDFRPEYGACSTIITEYLVIAGVDLTPQVATALFYGIKTDTRDLSRKRTDADVEAYQFLFPLVDRESLAKIEYPKLPIEYFRSFYRALENTELYDGVVISKLGDLHRPDLVAEIAELMLRLEGARFAIAIGFYRKDLYLSFRTEAPEEADAALVVREIVGDMGSAGGHNVMAGAFIPNVPVEKRDELIGQIVERLLSMLLPENKKLRKSKLV
ncbi:MAG: phosphoesterase [Candidatus Hydrothermota bacterium]|nr:MAG: phosphoesterase [Candidatus Hydrothermae bacterium]